jgi:hypothetical protein
MKSATWADRALAEINSDNSTWPDPTTKEARMETTVSFDSEQLARVPDVREAVEEHEAKEQTEGTVPGGWQPGDDPEMAPEGAFLGTQKLSGQLGLLPETNAVKFTGTVGVEGAFHVGEVIEGTFRAIVSGDNTSAKVKDGELGEPGKVQTATILSAERV